MLLVQTNLAMGVPWHLGVLDVRLTSVSELEGKLAKEARRFAVKPLSFLYRNPKKATHQSRTWTVSRLGM